MIIVIQILAFAGFLISLYFVLVYHRLVLPNARWIPAVCRMEEGACEDILRTRDAHLLGVPNAHLGAVIYGVLFLSTFILKPFTGVADGFMIVFGVLVGTGVYLSYSLLVVLKKKCVLCFAVHALNLLLFLLFILYQ